MRTIVAHNSRFHSDDVFAVATLKLTGEEFAVVRTRDKEAIESADIVVDVGGEYNPEKNRFDHHQEGGAGRRENGIPYASFGLVWKTYGPQICAGRREVSDAIDQRLVQPVDSLDNGENIFSVSDKKVYPYLLQDVISTFNPSWTEGEEIFDEMFAQAVSLAEHILRREIKKTIDRLDAEEKVRAIYEATSDKRLIVLDEYIPYELFLSSKPEPLIVVRPNVGGDFWKVEVMEEDYISYSYKKRILLPLEWAGKRDSELAEITGIPDAVFCHNARFLAVAKSKESALALAKLALSR